MPFVSFDDQPSAGFVDFDALVAAKPDQGDLGRGFKESFQQLPQMGYGLVAGAGAAAESAFGEGGIATGIKKAGIKGYEEAGAKIAQNAKPSDSWNYSYDKAKEGEFGALVDWLQHGIGYVGGQAAQTLLTGGLGAVGGKFVAGTAAKQIAEGMVAKEVANIAASDAGRALAAEQISRLATANVAQKFAMLGQNAAVGASALGMEGGEIYGDLAATNKDRALTGSEIGKAFAATLGAGALEFVGDKVGLDIMLGKSKLLKPAESMAGMGGRATRGAIAAAGAAPIEAGTEYAQTLTEEYGKGRDAFSPESLAQARDAAALGALGGTTVGGAGGALRGAKTLAQQPTATAPAAAPLQIGNTPDPMVSFPDGTIARRSEIEAHINSLPADQQGAARAWAMGLAQQPAKVDPVQSVMAAPSVDDAIAAAEAATAADNSDLADLQQSEARNLQVLQAQIAQDRIKQQQLAQVYSQSVETLGRLPDQQVAAARAATDETPTAMQLAMQRAQQKEANVSPTPDLPRPVATSSGAGRVDATASLGNGAIVEQRLDPNGAGPADSGLVEPGVRPALDAARPLDQRLIPKSKRNVQDQAPRANPEATQAAPAQAPAAARPIATGQPAARAQAGAGALAANGVKPPTAVPVVPVVPAVPAGNAGNSQVAPQSQVPIPQGKRVTTTGQAVASVVQQGKEVSRYIGKFNKGMGRDAARLEAQRLNRTADGIAYTAEEHDDPKLENPYAVVGRKTVKTKQSVALAKPDDVATEKVADDKATPAQSEQTESRNQETQSPSETVDGAGRQKSSETQKTAQPRQGTDALGQSEQSQNTLPSQDGTPKEDAPQFSRAPAPGPKVSEAIEFLNAAKVFGMDRLNLLKAIKDGSLTQEELQSAYPDVKLSETKDASHEQANDGQRDIQLRPEAERSEQDMATSLGGKPAPRGWASATRISREGRPITVYRGAAEPLSPGNFGLASLGKASGNPSSGLGVWFTTGKGEAQSYGKASSHQLDIRNPKLIKADDLPGFDSVDEAHAYREKLRKQGYDGIIVSGKHLGKSELHVVAFEPEQVIDPSGKTQFSRGERAARGITQEQFTAELAKAFGAKVADKLQANGVVVPLADQSKLPDHVVPFLRDGDIIFGFYDPETNKTYAVLENLTPKMVKGLTLHEVGVHYGFENMLGEAKYAAVVKRLDLMRRAGNKQVKAAYAEAAANAVNDSQVAEETIAYLVQNHPEMGMVAEIIAKIKAFLFNNFGIGGKYLAPADIQMLARAAVDHASRDKDGGSTLPAFMREGGKSDQTETEAFKKWFGDSKVVDANGKPLVMYHGTDQSFDQFSKEKVKSRFPYSFGLHFTNRTGEASIYADSITNAAEGFNPASKFSKPVKDGGNVMPVYLKAENPLVIKTDMMSASMEADINRYDIMHKLMAAKKAGKPYDSVVIKVEKGNEYDGINVIVFEPEQVKSATGNNGQFDASNPDIRFSRASIVGQTTRQHTPEQLRAMKNVGFQTEEVTLKERAQALWKDAGKKLAQGIADQFAPVKDLDKNAYAMLRLAKGASGAFEAFLQGGKLKLTDGVYDFDDTNKGGVIDKLLIPLQGEHHDFMRWVAANRAERLAGEGKENLFSAQDIADLKTLANGTTDFDYAIQTGPAKGRVTRDRTLIYADANRVFNEFNRNVLDMAEQSGLIDGASRQVWEHEFYVPFYRVADEDGGGVRGMSVKGSALRQQAFKELKGGKNALNADLLDNTLMNWAHLLDAAAKNRAAKATIEAAERMGVATGGNQSTLASMGASINNKNGVVWFMDGGQKRYSLIDNTGEGPYLMTALNALEYAGMRNPVMNAMGAMKHALTVGVTASPFFKIRNLIRDSVQAIGTGNLGYNPAANIAQGWKLTDPKSDAYFRLLAGGGTIHFGTMMEGSEAKRVQSLVESGVDDATILNSDHKVKAFYRKFIEPGVTAYNELGNRGEAINRAALYDQLVKRGMNHAEASLQARDLMDFSMQGSFTSIRFLTQVVPFLNARIQGLYKLGKSAKENPQRFGAVLGAVTMASLGLLAAYGDDDDWKKREEWDRNNFWWFKFGGQAFRIPKPFEIGAIATLAERGFELAFDKEMTNKRFMSQVMTLLGDNLSMNPVPQLAKPMLDVYANKDSFSGRPIETMGMDKLKADYRFTDRTSMTARAISTGMNAVTELAGKESLSPVQVDSMLRGYFGWLGSFVIGAADVLARPATGQAEHPSSDLWKAATGGMTSDLRDAPSRYVSQMYEQAKELEQAYGTWRALQKEGKTMEAAEFYGDNKDKLSKYRSVETVKRAEAKFNERIRMIERSNMQADEKRELIRSIQNQKDRVARLVS